MTKIKATSTRQLRVKSNTIRQMLFLIALLVFVAALPVEWSKSFAILNRNHIPSGQTDSSIASRSDAATRKRFLSLALPVTSCIPPTGIIISEFRLRGANGVNDEFVEFYNNTDQNIAICTADGSPGWAAVSSDGVVRFVIPTGTIIPARAHYLVTGSGYGLSNYATPDLSFTPDTPDNLGLALFNSSSPINFTAANRLDAVGFTTVTNTLYREGTGLSPLSSTNGQYSFFRKLNAGFPQDTGNNATDFTFVATDAGNYGGGPAILGAPSPENLSSPLQRNSQLPMGLLDPAVGSSVAPNRVRNTAAVGPNAAAGTLTLRRKITNNTTGAVTRLRVRVVDITTLNTPGYVQGGSQADMRALTSSDETVNLSNGTQVLVRGTTVETPPAQPNAGGLNSSLGVFAFSLTQPLPAGGTANVQFVLGVQQSGTFRFFVNIEADSNSVPGAFAGGPYNGPTGTPISFNGSGSYDLEGPIDNYQWNFGDNSSATGPTPSHVYSSPGTYTVTLTVTDSIGQTSVGSTTATIYPASNQLPVAVLNGPFTTVSGQPTSFSGASCYDPDGTISEYKWDFAGLASYTGSSGTFTFTNIGTYIVTLSITDNLGAKSWTSINVTVGYPVGEEQQVQSSNVSDWDAINRNSLDDPTNDRANPPNEATGNNNFQLTVPVVSLPGRGMNLNLNLVYNSLLWNKSGSEMFYDIDHDWPAPGWHFGFGKMVNMGTAGALLIEPDGSRHSFTGTVAPFTYPARPGLPGYTVPVFTGHTTDGSLIDYRCEMQNGSNGQAFGLARYPNGTTVYYHNYSTDFTTPKMYLYPTQIVDANGNITSIKYLWELTEPRIERIVDTVGRVITFHYDTQKRLTSVTAPGLKDTSGNPTTHTFVRLHYSTQPITLSGAFSGLVTHVRNQSPSAIDAIYFPSTGTGYWFPSGSYSSYGMLKKVTQQRGMTFTPSSGDEQGTVTQGVDTRVQTYDYPATPPAGGLTVAPVFSKVTETWDGSSSAPETTFVSQDNGASSERTITVTNPDGTKTVQISYSLHNPPETNPDKFKDGLVKEEKKLDANGNVLLRTVFTWEQGPDKSPRLTRTDTTDERNQTITKLYDQYGTNNFVGRARELDYSGATLRTTINTPFSYVDNDLELGLNGTQMGQSTVRRPRRINLVKTTKVFEGEDSVNKLVAFTEIGYDEYLETLQAYQADRNSWLDIVFIDGTSHQPNGITGVLAHNAYWNPSPSTPDGNGGVGSQNYITARGNVTSITRYADTSNPSSPASPITEKMKYDMTGNVISASKLCCEQSSSSFALSTQYAFPVSQTRGASDLNSLLRVTTSATFDLATGLPLSVTDANGRTTQTNYDVTSQRPKEIILPTDARTFYDYDDSQMKVTETVRLSATGTIAKQTTKYFNGQGQIIKEEALGPDGLDVVDTLYDQFNRLSKQSTPHRPAELQRWVTTIYDAAGRVSEVRQPAVGVTPEDQEICPTTKYFYNESTRPQGASAEFGTTMRTLDQWNRFRWVRLDALGRVAEVVEPNPDSAVGFQTLYTYDLHGLTKVEQGAQVRRFRYDSLGRLTHQKLAERSATLDTNGVVLASPDPATSWSDVFTYDERSNLISHIDARGVKAEFKYKDAGDNPDPLNRLQSVSYNTSGVPASITVLPAPTVNYQYRTKTSASNLIDVTQLKQVEAVGVSTEGIDYDAEGRLKEKSFTFNGRPQAMKTTYAYDSLGRLDTLTYPEQFHDNVSNPVRKIVTPSYDSASRLKGIKVNSVDYASSITYNAASQITSELIGTGANQLTENYTYETPTGFLSTQSVARGTNILLKLRYEYKTFYCDEYDVCIDSPQSKIPTGQLTRVKVEASTGADLGHYQHFSYDALGRLKSADRGEFIYSPGVWQSHWQQTYSYDRYGNRTTVTATSMTGVNPIPQDGTSLSFDSATNRITSSGFSYDPAGNQLTNNTGQTFVYDAAGRLAKVKNSSSGTTLVTYTYGSSNHRLITQTGAESSTDKTYYIWEGNSVITEYTEQVSATMPKWSKNYIYQGGRLLATEEPNGTGEIVHYQHPDRLGTRLVTNNVDTSSFQQFNLPFGTAESVESTNRRFTSYDRSTTTGLDYAVNRQYDPRQGRFTQPDPLGMGAASLADPQSLNMYSYVGNDPINRVDPDGQFWGALFRFIGGLFKSLKPNVINGSFTYKNQPPISVSFTTNFQNIGVGYGGFGFALRNAGQWLPGILQGRNQNVQKLSSCLVELLSPLFPGLDLTQIKIHTTGIPKIVEWFNTVQGGVGAVTWGNDIYYPRSGYNPYSNESIAFLAHEIDHVWQFKVLGKARFAKQYAEAYLKNIVSQLPAQSLPKWPWSGYLLDTAGVQSAMWKRWLEEARKSHPALDLYKAYRDIPFESEAFEYERDVLRYLNEISDASGKGTLCP